MGVHGTSGGLTIDLSGPPVRTWIGGGVRGRLDAGLRTLSSACALASGAPAPEERGGDEAGAGRAPHDQRRDGAAHQPAGRRSEEARHQARRSGGDSRLQQSPAPRALLRRALHLSLIHISEPTRLGMISYAVFCLKKKKT